MKTRPLCWEDLKVEVSTRTDFNAGTPCNRPRKVWKDSSGRTRVHASLIHCSFVMKTFWFKDFNPDNPAQRASILIQLQRNLRKIVHRLKVYEADNKA